MCSKIDIILAVFNYCLPKQLVLKFACLLRQHFSETMHARDNGPTANVILHHTDTMTLFLSQYNKTRFRTVICDFRKYSQR